jgi:hypothetical protein
VAQGILRSRQCRAEPGKATIRPLGVGQENGRRKGRQAYQKDRCAEARRINSLALAERDGVPLGLNPAFLILLSQAQVDLVRKVEGQTSFGTQRRSPIPHGLDHKGSEEQQPNLSDDLEANHWRTGKGKRNAGVN